MSFSCLVSDGLPFLSSPSIETDLQPDIPGWACGRLKVKKKVYTTIGNFNLEISNDFRTSFSSFPTSVNANLFSPFGRVNVSK